MAFNLIQEVAIQHRKVIEKLPNIIERAKNENDPLIPAKDNDMAIAISAINASLTVFMNVLNKYDQHMKQQILDLEQQIKKQE